LCEDPGAGLFGTNCCCASFDVDFGARIFAGFNVRNFGFDVDICASIFAGFLFCLKR
jgi:hypothetical protein